MGPPKRGVQRHGPILPWLGRQTQAIRGFLSYANVAGFCRKLVGTRKFLYVPHALLCVMPIWWYIRSNPAIASATFADDPMIRVQEPASSSAIESGTATKCAISLDAPT